VFVPTRNVIGNDGKNHQHRPMTNRVDVIAAVALEAMPAWCHRLRSGFPETGHATSLLLVSVRKYNVGLLDAALAVVSLGSGGVGDAH
jgi:hypothetical protein